jgi:hypothetical protein
VTDLETVEVELARYFHALLRFSMREHDGAVELVMDLKRPLGGTHVYYAPVPKHIIHHREFSALFQKFLYDCMRDYLVQMFLRTPDSWEGDY